MALVGERSSVVEWDRAPLLDSPDLTDVQPGNGASNGAVDDDTSKEPQLETKVYARRWYVLFVFCLMNMAQNIGWNTWGPVSDSATLVFGWSGAEIGLFATIGNFSYSLTVFGASYIMDVLGLRVAALGMTAMLLVGAAIRCITSHKVILFWMSVISAVLSGVAGTVTFSGSALFSSIWFPASQRGTATAMVNTFNFLGVSATFLLGPALVHFVNPYKNITSSPEHLEAVYPYSQALDIARPANMSTNHTGDVIKKQTDEIMMYMYVETGIMAALFLMVLVYFPSKPPLPPSVSASTSRLSFRAGLWALTKNKSFWLLALAYAIPAGLFGVWGTVLNVNLSPIGVTQSQAAQIGLYYNLAGGLAGLVISRFSDIMSGHMKQILIGLYVAAAGTLLWITMLSERYITFNLPSLFVSTCLASVFLNSGVALFYELSSEMCYPVAEGVIGGYLTLVNNLVGIIFLCVLYVPNIGTAWMNWTMFVGTVIGIPLLFLVKARYRRLQMDRDDQDTSLQTDSTPEPTVTSPSHA